ncbi:MAG: ABC transporter permease [Actinomycetes bacterium]|jgi:ABC-type dipeptide/oligopeptide/nickel transport system permease component|nr:ABC transporter permease [Actinomycetes bacterium]
MGLYILKRIGQFIPVFFGVTLILFLVANFLPGVDPVQMKVGEKAVTPQLRAEITKAYGLDKPWYIQYVNYLKNLAHGDLGNSLKTGRPVKDILLEKYPYTLKLSLCAIAIEAVVGIGAGVISAVKQRSFADIITTLLTSISVSLPVFWLGLILQIVFGIWLKNVTGGAFYLPISGASGPLPTWMYYIMPSIVLACVSTGYTARIMRSQLIEVRSADYVRTAKAKGLSGRRVLWGHEMKNALIPVLTFIGIDFGVMLAGAILTETVFNWPGVGNAIATAIFSRDFAVVTGGTTVILIMVMVISLLVDIGYALLDPRIRLSGTGE